MVRAEIWFCRDQNFYDKVLMPWPNSSKLAHILYTVATQCQQRVSARHIVVPLSPVYISYVKMQYPAHVGNICCIICGYWEQHTAVLLHCPLLHIYSALPKSLPNSYVQLLNFAVACANSPSSYQRGCELHLKGRLRTSGVL